jgi:RHH-type proline utilization regulon transcriptional repressor/proline dehydrogenase/delta 1-pyrroline-5-carboxylate dehydrogenase
MSAGFDFALAPPADDDLGRLRRRIASECRGDETQSVGALIAEARLAPDELARAQEIASKLAEAVRVERSNAGGVDALMLEFSLESREGIALMCLAEALLRIPDAATRDGLIRDKISRGDWSSHVGASPSLFVNARRGACSSPDESSIRAARERSKWRSHRCCAKGASP